MRRKAFVEPFSFWMEHGMYNSRCLSLVWSKLLNSIIFNTKKNYFFLLNHGENLNLFCDMLLYWRLPFVGANWGVFLDYYAFKWNLLASRFQSRATKKQ
jgi:hypothetical protein